MRELELDGIHEDGEHVLLVDSDHERYTLRIDKALRAAVRSDRPALNMIQAADAAPLRPREIQALLRSGRSAEDIAEASQIPLEHVRRYEGPVLAEREWTAQRARTFPVGRGGPALLDVVRERLAAREATGDTAWDAWRRADGTWTLELSFAAGGRTRQAHWVADVDNRTVTPVDDEARWISDEDAPPEPVRGRGRLQAVKSSVYDLEADGSLEGNPAGTSRQRTWTPRRSSADVPSQHPSVIAEDELEALNARRGLRPVPRAEATASVWSGLDEAEEAAAPEASSEVDGLSSPDEEAAREHSRAGFPDMADQVGDPESLGDVDGGADAGDSDGREDPGATSEADPTGREGVDADDAPDGTGWRVAASAEGEDVDREADRPEATTRSSASEPTYEDTVDLTPLPGFGEEGASEAEEPAPKPVKKGRARSRRASMPSWDEIVFGSKHE